MYTTQHVSIPNYRILRPVTKIQGQYKESKSKNNLGARLDYTIDGTVYTIVTSLKEFDVCTSPDRFYFKIGRATKLTQPYVIGRYC